MPYAEVLRADEFFSYLGNMVDFSRPNMLVFKEFTKSVALFEGISYNVVVVEVKSKLIYWRFKSFGGGSRGSFFCFSSTVTSRKK